MSYRSFVSEICTNPAVWYVVSCNGLRFHTDLSDIALSQTCIASLSGLDIISDKLFFFRDLGEKPMHDQGAKSNL